MVRVRRAKCLIALFLITIDMLSINCKNSFMQFQNVIAILTLVSSIIVQFYYGMLLNLYLMGYSVFGLKDKELLIQLD